MARKKSKYRTKDMTKQKLWHNKDQARQGLFTHWGSGTLVIHMSEGGGDEREQEEGKTVLQNKTGNKF